MWLLLKGAWRKWTPGGFVRSLRRRCSGDDELTLNFKDYLHQSDYILPLHGHRCFVLQPDVRAVSRRNVLFMTPERRLAEACALVRTLPQWSVADAAVEPVRPSVHPMTVFGSGKIASLTDRLARLTAAGRVSAVFVSVDLLSAVQLSFLQKQWRLPVYDRFTMVLQIFKVHAISRDAKIQVALAELPFIRSRLVGVHEGTLDQQRGSLAAVGGTGETQLELKRRLLAEKSRKLRAALDELRAQRQMLRAHRRRALLPTVAVVGYTNAGKTSLIRYLCPQSDLQPRDQLFATLDVTSHLGVLPESHLKCLFVDTVGFITDLPLQLISAFEATLADALEADLLLIVHDVSDPSVVAQREVVLRTLNSLSALRPALVENALHVGTKADLATQPPSPSPSEHSDWLSSLLCVSVNTGQNMLELCQLIESRLIATSNVLKATIRLPQADADALSWLHRHASVADVDACPMNANFLLANVLLDRQRLDEFFRRFSRLRRFQNT